MNKEELSGLDVIQLRRDLILQILSGEKRYNSQTELLEYLNLKLKEKGLNSIATATLSRDFGKLGIVKGIDGNYIIPDLTKIRQDKQSLADLFMKNPDTTLFGKLDFFMISTEEGMSQYIGRKLISVYSNELLGFIPGNNFVLMISKEGSKAEDLKGELSKLIQGRLT